MLQYRAFSLRCTVLSNQLEEATQEEKLSSERGATAMVVLSHLQLEEAAAAGRLRQVPKKKTLSTTPSSTPSSLARYSTCYLLKYTILERNPSGRLLRLPE